MSKLKKNAIKLSVHFGGIGSMTMESVPKDGRPFTLMERAHLLELFGEHVLHGRNPYPLALTGDKGRRCAYGAHLEREWRHRRYQLRCAGIALRHASKLWEERTKRPRQHDHALIIARMIHEAAFHSDTTWELHDECGACLDEYLYNSTQENAMRLCITLAMLAGAIAADMENAWAEYRAEGMPHLRGAEEEEYDLPW